MSVLMTGQMVEGGELRFTLEQVEKVFPNDRIVWVTRPEAGTTQVWLVTIKAVLEPFGAVTSNLAIEDRTVQDVVRDRDEFMRVLRELLGLEEPVAIWDLKNWIIGRVRALQSDRDRLLKDEERLLRQLVQRLETDLLLSIDEELPLMSRTRIVRERIRTMVRQTSSLEWFLSEVEMAVGLRPDETPTQNERMHKVIKLLAELVDRP